MDKGVTDIGCRNRGSRFVASCYALARSLRYVALAASVCCASSPTMAQAPQCVNAADVGLYRMRAMQTALMVSALGCSGLREQYNVFVVSYGEAIRRNGAALTARFNKKTNNLKLARRKMDRFVTSLANEASQKQMQNQPAFCAAAARAFAVMNDATAYDVSKKQRMDAAVSNPVFSLASVPVACLDSITPAPVYVAQEKRPSQKEKTVFATGSYEYKGNYFPRYRLFLHDFNSPVLWFSDPVGSRD